MPGDATVVVSTKHDGDFAIDSVPSWVTLHQVHSNRVIEVESTDCGVLGDGDALVTTARDVTLVVRGADCPLIGLASNMGHIAAVHAGWRGLAAGVIEEAAAVMRRAGAQQISAVVGPYIGPECYEFSPVDLDPLIERFGQHVQSVTASGGAALDLGACIAVSFARAEIEAMGQLGGCTACSGEFYSWRKFADVGRHALAISMGPIGFDELRTAGE